MKVCRYQVRKGLLSEGDAGIRGGAEEQALKEFSQGFDIIAKRNQQGEL